jgi:branched-chain amino acid aminotransferase
MPTSFHDSIVFIDGRFVPYKDATLGLMTHGFLYGTGCFEGLRGYARPDGDVNLLAPREHFRRLHSSARTLRMNVEHSAEELTEIVRELCRRNGYREDVYVRATHFKSAEQLGIRLDGIAESTAIVAFPFPADGYYAGKPGLHACVSAWRRVDDNAAPARAKITGIYINSALAKNDALAAGYDEAIVLNDDGHVAEASAANVFLIRDDALVTPDVSQNVLEGITRSIVLRLAQANGLRIVERQVDRSELYAADELFICGTAVGVMPVLSVDRIALKHSGPGSYASRLRERFEAGARGESGGVSPFVVPVYASATVEPVPA